MVRINARASKEKQDLIRIAKSDGTYIYLYLDNSGGGHPQKVKVLCSVIRVEEIKEK